MLIEFMDKEEVEEFWYIAEEIRDNQDDLSKLHLRVSGWMKEGNAQYRKPVILDRTGRYMWARVVKTESYYKAEIGISESETMRDPSHEATIIQFPRRKDGA